jgi:hypothetical protein
MRSAIVTSSAQSVFFVHVLYMLYMYAMQDAHLEKHPELVAVKDMVSANTLHYDVQHFHTTLQLLCYKYWYYQYQAVCTTSCFVNV